MQRRPLVGMLETNDVAVAINFNAEPLTKLLHREGFAVGFKIDRIMSVWYYFIHTDFSQARICGHALIRAKFF